MSFTIVSAKLTGAPDASGWAQVHEFKPEDREKLKLRGHLFAVVATGRHERGVDSVVAGRELLARLHEEYFGKKEASAFTALKASLTRVIEEFSSSWGDVEIAAVSVLNDVVYAAAGGGAQVSIFRDGMLAKILLSEKEAVVSASGYPRHEDILLLATGKFFEIFPEGIVRAAMQTKDPASCVETLAPTLHTQETTGNLGAAILKFGRERRFLTETTAGVLPEISKPRRETFLKLTRVSLFFEKLLSKLPDRRIYVRAGHKEKDTTQKSKLTVSAGVILLLLLFVSIFFGIRERRVKEVRELYEPKLVQAQHELAEAVELFSLNPARARQLFTQARQKVKGLQDEGVDDPRLLLLAGELSEKEESVLGEYKGEPELSLELSLLSDGFDGDDMASSGEKLYVLDAEGRKIIGTFLATKKSEVVAGPDQVENASSIAAYIDRVFVVRKDGIDELGEEKRQVIEGDWEGSVLAYAYAGNLYVLDKGSATIWRHTGFAGGFARGKKWFVEGVEPDLSKVISWTIDGTVWLLNDSGEIFKYLFGTPQNFSVEGLIPELTNPAAIYSNEELEFLYILEPEHERVVVLDKSGKYKAQYLSPKLREAKDLVVSEKEKKIIFLTSKALYSIELKRLED